MIVVDTNIMARLVVGGEGGGAAALLFERGLWLLRRFMPHPTLRTVYIVKDAAKTLTGERDKDEKD